MYINGPGINSLNGPPPEHSDHSCYMVFWSGPGREPTVLRTHAEHGRLFIERFCPNATWTTLRPTVYLNNKTGGVRVGLYHEDWEQQQVDGRDYATVFTRREFHILVAAQAKKKLAEREQMAATAAEYQRPEQQPFSALPDSIKSRITFDEQGCWLWSGPCDSRQGYGVVYLPKRQRARAHRHVYEALVGPIPEGLMLRHTCDRPECVNPGHLIPGTGQQNYDDMVSHGRAPSQHPRDRTSRHLRRKLSAADVKAIHAAIDRGVEYPVIAGQFKVASRTVRGIAKGYFFPEIFRSKIMGK